MFLYWLIIVIIIVKMMEYIDKVKERNIFNVNISKKKRNSIPSEIQYL